MCIIVFVSASWYLHTSLFITHYNVQCLIGSRPNNVSVMARSRYRLQTLTCSKMGKPPNQRGYSSVSKSALAVWQMSGKSQSTTAAADVDRLLLDRCPSSFQALVSNTLTLTHLLAFYLVQRTAINRLVQAPQNIRSRDSHTTDQVWVIVIGGRHPRSAPGYSTTRPRGKRASWPLTSNHAYCGPGTRNFGSTTPVRRNVQFEFLFWSRGPKHDTWSFLSIPTTSLATHNQRRISRI